MITQDEAIQMAREAAENEPDFNKSVTAFANAIERKTLLKAADLVRGETWCRRRDIETELRRMAGEE